MAGRIEGATPGDGSTSPFGNGTGGTMAGPNGPAQPEPLFKNIPQGGNPKQAPNPNEIPAGGAVTKADPSKQAVSGRDAHGLSSTPKPFKLGK
jgi:hypothetical protein